MAFDPAAGRALPPDAGPGAGGGPPPELLALLQGAGGPGGPGGSGGSPPGPGGPGPAPPDQAGPGGPGSQRQAITFLRDAIESIQNYINVEPDDIDVQAAMKVMAGLQQILAKDQKDMESAVGITPQVRFMRKAQGGYGA